jgi:hypothetical protein
MRIVLFVLLLALLGCHKEEFKKHNYDLTGKWRRIETYVNPGNGGDWQKDLATSPTTIEFTREGRLVSNSEFYSNFTNYKTSGGNTIELLPPLNGVSKAVYYSFNTDTELTLTFACIEGCGDRFVKY